MVDATVHYVHRGTIRTDVNHVLEGFVTGTTEEPDPATIMGEGPVYNLVIDHPAATILWDTGSHPDAGNGHWPAALYAAFEHADAAEYPLPTSLEAVGFALADIDCVIQTHLHLDHAGGLRHFAGTDVPVVVHRRELEHAFYSTATDRGDDAYLRADFDHALEWSVIDRDRVQLYEDLELLHLPGHTPGLLGVCLHVDGYGTLLLAGDECYNRRNYEAEHPLGGPLLWSKRDWDASLRWLQDLERRHDATVVCGHDPDDADLLAAGVP